MAGIVRDTLGNRQGAVVARYSIIISSRDNQNMYTAARSYSNGAKLHAGWTSTVDRYNKQPISIGSDCTTTTAVIMTYPKGRI